MLHVEVFTDPGCPFAWSAEPHARRIACLDGDQFEVTSRMVVLSERPEEYLETCFDPHRQATASAGSATGTGCRSTRRSGRG